MTEGDADFILRLLNEPTFLEFIGDKGVRTREDARAYILGGPVVSYEEYGFGLYVVERRTDGTPVGMCGLLKRDSLDHPDIGFALLPEHASLGYATEAAVAVMERARSAHGLERVVAITSRHNDASKRVLEKIGMQFEGMISLEPGADEICLFGTTGGPHG